MAKQEEDLIFNIGDRVIRFRISGIDDLDVDKILRIDYENLVAEILTFPVMVNKLGILCADMDNLYQQEKLDLSIYEAKAREKIRTKLGGEKDGKRVTLDEIDTQMTLDKVWKSKKLRMFRIYKEKEYVYSVWQSAKDKSSKLDKMSLTIKSGDINDKIIQGQLNNIGFKIRKGLIK